MRIRDLVVVASVVAAGSSMSVRAQSAARAEPKAFTLSVRALGGFLGQVEGFPEFPGGPADEVPVLPPSDPGKTWDRGVLDVLGGSLGALDWKRAEAAEPHDTAAPAERWFIVTPNNQTATFLRDAKPGLMALRPLTNRSRVPMRRAGPDSPAPPPTQTASFWDDIARLNPDVIGLGPEDFVRALRVPSSAAGSDEHSAEPARQFVDWLRGTDLKFLASNVSIRRHAANLVIKPAGPVQLSIDAGSSVSWIAPAKIQIPCGAAIDVSLEEFAPAGASTGHPVDVALNPNKSPDGCTQNYSASVVPAHHRALRPNAKYILRTHVGRSTQEFEFTTDALLTTDASRLPVTQKVNGSSVVVSLVDPSVRALAGDAAWSYGDDDDAREIVILDPAKTTQAIVAELGDSTPPVVVLVSALEDDTTLALLDKIPAIRAVLLPPDTALLGRASLVVKEDKKQYSGDLASTAVIDQADSESTRVLLRPEWFGETVAAVDAQLAPNTLQGQRVWALTTKMAPTTRSVPGWELSADPTSHGTVAYSVSRKGDPAKLFVAESAAYSADFEALWHSNSDKARWFLTHAIEQYAPADLAAMPQSAIDSDYLMWLSNDADQHRTSPFILEHILYRSPRIVRAYVSGGELVGALQKIVDHENNEGVCLTGVRFDGKDDQDSDAMTCTSAMDKAHPERARLHGLRIDAKLTYSIAMPDTLAEALKFAHSDKDPLFDSIAAVESDFRRFQVNEGGAPTNTVARHHGGYLAVSPLQFGYTRLAVSDKATSASRADLPIDTAKATPTSTWTVSSAGDLTPIDRRVSAIRVLGNLDLRRRRDDTPDAINPVSYDKDAFGVTGRFDFKVPLPRVFQEFRPYAQVVTDGQLHAATRVLTPTRSVVLADGAKVNEKAPFDVTLHIRPSKFYGAGFGGEVISSGVPLGRAGTLKVTTLGASFARGKMTNVVSGLTIDGTAVTSEELVLAKGLQSLLNSGFTSGSLASASQVLVVPGTLILNRIQADGALSLESHFWGNTNTFSVSGQYRHYSRDDSKFALTQTFVWSASANIPIWSHLSLAPTVSGDAARIASGDRFRTTQFSVMFNAPFFLKLGRGSFIR